ncbi:hypothetical protein LJC27_01840 [Christensenellaceae bacterium OttesenSCG-928-M15]|nr:hypothetical protein [Christensenellaceae bacterium OttesenSCG-928-M15]
MSKINKTVPDTETAPERSEQKFTREQLLRGKHGVEADVLTCALKQDRLYTKKEAEDTALAYLKKGVKS